MTSITFHSKKSMPTNLRYTIKHYDKQLKLRVTKQVYKKGPTKNIYDISLTIQSTVMTTKFTYQATRTRIINIKNNILINQSINQSVEI